ncbi:MAG TPA: carbohydrate binding domain-containing protein, partial [Chthoniobacterales bacterium]
VHAQNLVQNPGFETGDFPPWVDSGDTSFSSVSSNNPHTGTFSAQMGPSSSDGFLDQTIPTTIGQNYTVDFWLSNSDDTNNNDFSASFGGVTVLSLTNADQFGYTEFTMNVTATSSSSDMHFAFYNPPSYWYLDDVSVTAAVPEPTTVALIAFGALGLAGAIRKRFSA